MLRGEEYADAHAQSRFRRNASAKLPVGGHVGAVAIGDARGAWAYERPTAAVSIAIVVRSLCICISGLFPDCATRTTPRPRQPRNGSGPAWPPPRGLGRRADASAGTRRGIRFSVRQRFPLES